MAANKAINDEYRYPILKTVEQMSRISGLGENKLRDMMDRNEIDFIWNGNRRLLTVSAVLDWYKKNRVEAKERKQ